MRATHLFLSEDDIVAMRPEVHEGLRAVPQLAVAFDDGAPLGFAGVADGKLEMLFVDDAARGRGIGSALLKHAVDRWGVHRLDANEQNPAARGFYEHEGFRVASRSELDEAGRPFPPPAYGTLLGVAHAEQVCEMRAAERATRQAWGIRSGLRVFEPSLGVCEPGLGVCEPSLWACGARSE